LAKFHRNRSIRLCDADDDHVIAAAVAARAELIVTGDRKHLLPIGSHQGIAIVTVREVVDRLGPGARRKPAAGLHTSERLTAPVRSYRAA
jgi:hypothetical protein